MEPTTWKVEPEQNGQRADQVVAQAMGITRSAAQKWLEQERVTLPDGRPLGKSDRVTADETLIITPPEPEPCEALPQDIPLDVVYEDDDLLVVNKVKGMVVHPAAGNPDGTLVNALLAHCQGRLSGIGGVLRPGIVHRIDKETSGLLIVAKTDIAHQGLAQQIKEHSFTRVYEAVIVGHLKDSNGTVHAPIGRHPTDRKKMAVTQKNAKTATTHYTVLTEYAGFSHVRLRLETGRTHQIRVHMAYLGHPVAGDIVYGSAKPSPLLQKSGLVGQCLHARVIGFVHPRTGEYMEFDSGLPAYFETVLQTLTEITTT